MTTIGKENGGVYKWWVTVISAMTMMGYFATITAYAVTLPIFSEELGVAQSTAAFGGTTFIVGLVIGIFMGGFVSDRIGIKGAVLLAMILLIVPQVIIPYVTNFTLILVLRFIQGLACLAWPPLVGCVVGWVTGKRRGLAVGIYFGAALAGSTVGGVVAGLVIPTMGWQGVFWVLGIITAILTVIWYCTVRVPGSSENPGKNPEEKKEKVGYGQLIRMPQTWLFFLFTLGATYFLYGLLTCVPAYGYFLGYDETQVANLTIALGIGSFIAAVLAGFIGDAFTARLKNAVRGRALAMALIATLAVIGALLLPVAGGWGYGALFVVVIVAMFGNIGPQAISWALPAEIFPAALAVAGAGFAGGLGNILSPVSPIVVGVWLAPSWFLAWGTCAFMSVVSIVACIFLMRYGGKIT